MTKRRGDKKNQVNWRTDWWLWPSALLLALGGWSQALWMWENTAPTGRLEHLVLLLWVGAGITGVTLPLYWFSRRWQPVAWLAVAAWAAVPTLNELASDPGWRGYNVSPLLLLLLLGLGLGGVMMTVSWLAGRRWPGPTPDVRPLRQGVWAGLLAMVCGWLLINGAFSLVSVALLAGALVLIETFFITRESPR
jgi:hypothetical protein